MTRAFPIFATLALAAVLAPAQIVVTPSGGAGGGVTSFVAGSGVGGNVAGSVLTVSNTSRAVLSTETYTLDTNAATWTISWTPGGESAQRFRIYMAVTGNGIYSQRTWCRPNGNTATNHSTMCVRWTSGASPGNDAGVSTNTASGFVLGMMNGTNQFANVGSSVQATNYVEILLENPNATGDWKHATSKVYGTFNAGAAPANYECFEGRHTLRSTEVVSNLVLYPTTGNVLAGARAERQAIP